MYLEYERFCCADCPNSSSIRSRELRSERVQRNWNQHFRCADRVDHTAVGWPFGLVDLPKGLEVVWLGRTAVWPTVQVSKWHSSLFVCSLLFFVWSFACALLAFVWLTHFGQISLCFDWALCDLTLERWWDIDLLVAHLLHEFLFSDFEVTLKSMCSILYYIFGIQFHPLPKWKAHSTPHYYLRTVCPYHSPRYHQNQQMLSTPYTFHSAHVYLCPSNNDSSQWGVHAHQSENYSAIGQSKLESFPLMDA